MSTMSTEPATKSKRASGWLSSAKQSLKAIGHPSGSSTASPSASSSASTSEVIISRDLSGNGGEDKSGGSKAASILSRTPSARWKGKDRADERTSAEGRATLTSDMPSIAPRKIIGAVEDEWPLYRCVKHRGCASVARLKLSNLRTVSAVVVQQITRSGSPSVSVLQLSCISLHSAQRTSHLAQSRSSAPSRSSTSIACLPRRISAVYECAPFSCACSCRLHPFLTRSINTGRLNLWHSASIRTCSVSAENGSTARNCALRSDTCLTVRACLEVRDG